MGKTFITGIFFVQLVIQLNAQKSDASLVKMVSTTLKTDIIYNAKWSINQLPIIVTAEQCVRSAGGLHIFYSEGGYWWPDPKDASAPYIITKVDPLLVKSNAGFYGLSAQSCAINKSDKNYPAILKHALVVNKIVYEDDQFRVFEEGLDPGAQEICACCEEYK